jgi:hypothetical protein
LKEKYYSDGSQSELNKESSLKIMNMIISMYEKFIEDSEKKKNFEVYNQNIVYDIDFIRYIFKNYKGNKYLK